MKKLSRNTLLIAGTALTGVHVVICRLVKIHKEKGIHHDDPYFNGNRDCENPAGVYEHRMKPALDKILSFGGLVVLSPLFVIISVAVWVDDPGPVFFTQKRVGKDKEVFMLHKFRSMKMSTPHDVPTHELREPERYITCVGKVLRRTSLDELPQIWDIFRGRMSVIGPRPALWNQDDLVSERDRYGANSVLPGLTGLAQIHGRDELLIAEKARIDGAYVRVLKAGGWRAFRQDVGCFAATVASVIKHDGVVEGGTGALSATVGDWQTKASAGRSKASADKAGFGDYGFQKRFDIDKKRHVRVLITGWRFQMEGRYRSERVGRQ